MEDFCREEQISPAAYYRWQRKYGGLEAKNAKLKRLAAEVLLADEAIREFKKSMSPEERYAMLE